MPSINLMKMTGDAATSAITLQELALCSKAPLRLEERKGQIYLRERGLRTYLFEKIVASPLEVHDTRVKTHLAIEKYARALLNQPDANVDPLKAEVITNALHTRAAEQLITRPGFLPPKDPTDSTTKNKDSKKIGLNKVCEKAIDDVLLVQQGLSISQPNSLEQPNSKVKEHAELFMGVIDLIFNPLSDKNVSRWIRHNVAAIIKPTIRNSTLHVIADVRLIRKETLQSASKDLLSWGHTAAMHDASHDFKTLKTKKDFQDYYAEQLNRVVGLIQTTVMLELPYDMEGVCSNTNVFGAADAAHEFIEKQKLVRKNISVMLVVPRLPTSGPKLPRKDSPEGKDSLTSPKGALPTKQNSILLNDDEDMIDGTV